jgi:hypothetical protein
MDFTQEEAEEVKETYKDLMDQMSDKRLTDFLGHLNEIGLMLNHAIGRAPAEEEVADVDEEILVAVKDENSANDLAGYVGKHPELEILNTVRHNE